MAVPLPVPSHGTLPSPPVAPCAPPTGYPAAAALMYPRTGIGSEMRSIGLSAYATRHTASVFAYHGTRGSLQAYPNALISARSPRARCLQVAIGTEGSITQPGSAIEVGLSFAHRLYCPVVSRSQRMLPEGFSVSSPHRTRRGLSLTE